jgi:hypothetical protein
MQPRKPHHAERPEAITHWFKPEEAETDGLDGSAPDE